MLQNNNGPDVDAVWTAATPYPRNASVHSLFEEQVSATPDAVALVLPGQSGDPARTMSYRALDQRADAIAAALPSRGAKPGDFVAVLMDRSAEMVASFLGILKAGCAYLPLDPSYPEARLDFMVADAQPSVLLTQSHFIGRVKVDAARTFVVDGAQAMAPGVAALVPRAADAPAYVIYTSGSTGRPKGVVVPHRGVVRLVRGTSYTRLDSSRVLLQLAPTSFDAATFEIWGALLNGGRCVLYPESGAPDLGRLQTVIAETGVTTMWLTASLFNMIIDAAPMALAGVDEILAGGEALSVAHVRKAYELLPHVQLINGYGPTESTTFACCYRIPRGFPADWRSIPIGPPIANTSVLLLDERHGLVAPGEIGDLYIGGDGLALGYLNRPELTAERFIRNPFGEANERLYVTGDRARLLPDGAIEFHGRLDDQIKIRGHRVELGEIETALRDHAAVGNAVVVLRDEGADKTLAAFYTVHTDASAPGLSELHGHLAARLPDYMIPSRFVRVEQIPLTPNGKADRAALPALSRERPDLETPMTTPRTPVEQWIAGHWRELLNLDEVGVHDRFFELGGTSILALRLLSRLSQDANAQLPTLLLFRAPTIAEMATILDAEHRDSLPESVVGVGDSVAPAANGMADRAAQRRDDLRERRLRRRLA